jgi:deazaflavin-dependent oxidoreductase (nitroreductase family)
VSDVATPSSSERLRPLLGLRHRPGRLALWLFRMPLQAYHHGKGWMMGHTFLLLTHCGRNTGRPHDTVAMVLRWRGDTEEAIVCSAWGPGTDWIKNIRQRPATQIEIGQDVFVPEQRFLSEQESLGVVEECLLEHPWRFRFIAKVLGWGDLRSEATVHEFVQARPFVAFTPSHTQKAA